MADFSSWVEKNKALWTRVYDEVIAPDLEEEWKKREEAHQKELKQKEENQQILYNHVETEVVKNSRLTSENEQLKAQLESSTKDTAATGDVGPAPPHTPITTHEDGQMTEKYNNLSKKYQDLSQKIKYLERKNTAVMQKNKDMKESVRAWQEYADRQSGKQKLKGGVKVDDDRPMLSAVPQIEDARPHMPSSPMSVTTVRTPPFLANTGRSSPAPIAPLAQAEAEGGDELASPRPQYNDETGQAENRSGSVTPRQSCYPKSSPHQPAESHEKPYPNVSSNTTLDRVISKHSQTGLPTIHPSSSQTTEDENLEQVARHTQIDSIAADDDDVPQFVSERSLKRKRGQAPKIDIWGDRSSDGTPVKPFRVKDEPLSSPPITYSLMRKDTIDLDDPSSTLLQTPRHPRRKSLLHSTATGTLSYQRSSSAPFSQAIKHEGRPSPASSHVPLQVGAPETTTIDARGRSEPSNSNDAVPNILQNLDANLVSNALGEPVNKRTKRGDVGGGKFHNILSESGEEAPPQDENAHRLAPGVVRAKLNRRLHHSTSPPPAVDAHQMRTPATTRIKMEQNPTPPSSSRATRNPAARTTQHDLRSTGLFKTRNGPAIDDRPRWSMKAHEPRPSAQKSRISPTRNQDRLRSKPVTELTVHDFKVNPAYNQGYSHAFSETVRKRGDRMCLPGCTNPQCCGSTFRTFAEAQGPLSLSQEEALLEDYLGDAYDNMSMTQMSTEERQELVLQARTKKMAKEAGKHREAYERRRSPPGFWRVDFPTTQEHQDDRERSKEQEKKIVQDRWLEAQRRGGKWIFRDE
jgi:hypothetical protein